MGIKCISINSISVHYHFVLSFYPLHPRWDVRHHTTSVTLTRVRVEVYSIQPYMAWNNINRTLRVWKRYLLLFYNKIFEMFQMYECGILWTFFSFYHGSYVHLYKIRIINICQMNHIHTNRSTRIGMHVHA
jgi:hypothetical protein